VISRIEIRECAACHGHVVYYGGRFQHLSDSCPRSPAAMLVPMTPEEAAQ
jgi:hypothetical protein